jgi:hypothetical protein
LAKLIQSCSKAFVLKNSNPKISRIEIFTFRAASRGLCEEEEEGGEKEAGQRGGAGEEGGEEEEERELLMRATSHCIRQHTSAYVSIGQRRRRRRRGSCC